MRSHYSTKGIRSAGSSSGGSSGGGVISSLSESSDAAKTIKALELQMSNMQSSISQSLGMNNKLGVLTERVDELEANKFTIFGVNDAAAGNKHIYNTNYINTMEKSLKAIYVDSISTGEVSDKYPCVPKIEAIRSINNINSIPSVYEEKDESDSRFDVYSNSYLNPILFNVPTPVGKPGEVIKERPEMYTKNYIDSNMPVVQDAEDRIESSLNVYSTKYMNTFTKRMPKVNSAQIVDTAGSLNTYSAYYINNLAVPNAILSTVDAHRSNKSGADSTTRNIYNTYFIDEYLKRFVGDDNGSDKYHNQLSIKKYYPDDVSVVNVSGSNNFQRLLGERLVEYGIRVNETDGLSIGHVWGDKTRAGVYKNEINLDGFEPFNDLVKIWDVNNYNAHISLQNMLVSRNMTEADKWRKRFVEKYVDQFVDVYDMKSDYYTMSSNVFFKHPLLSNRMMILDNDLRQFGPATDPGKYCIDGIGGISIGNINFDNNDLSMGYADMFSIDYFKYVDSMPYLNGLLINFNLATNADGTINEEALNKFKEYCPHTWEIAQEGMLGDPYLATVQLFSPFQTVNNSETFIVNGYLESCNGCCLSSHSSYCEQDVGKTEDDYTNCCSVTLEGNVIIDRQSSVKCPFSRLTVNTKSLFQDVVQMTNTLDVVGESNFKNSVNVTGSLTVDSEATFNNDTHINAVNVLKVSQIQANNDVNTIQVKSDLFVEGILEALSDARYKKDVNEIDEQYAKEFVERARPISYKMKDNDEKQRFGFIAQEIASIEPQLVTTHEDGHLTLNYIDMIAILMKEVQRLQKEVEELKGK